MGSGQRGGWGTKPFFRATSENPCSTNCLGTSSLELPQAPEAPAEAKVKVEKLRATGPETLRFFSGSCFFSGKREGWL